MAHLSVIGLRPIDETWNKMYAAYAACRAAQLSPPAEVLEFFEGVRFERIVMDGIEVDLSEAVAAYESGRDDATDGLDVDLSKLPAHVTKLRFKASY